MILRLLAPESGVLSKGKQEQWRFIEENLAPMLSQAAVDAKGEEYTRRLGTIAAKLAALDADEQSLEDLPTDAVETTTNESRGPAQNNLDLPAASLPAGEE